MEDSTETIPINRALLKTAIFQLIDAAKFQMDRTGCGGRLLITANALIAAEVAEQASSGRRWVRRPQPCAAS